LGKEEVTVDDGDEGKAEAEHWFLEGFEFE